MPVLFISDGLLFLYHYGMEELLERLEQIGFTHETCERIQERYEGDDEELRRYVMFCIAIFDNRRVYNV